MARNAEENRRSLLWELPLKKIKILCDILIIGIRTACYLMLSSTIIAMYHIEISLEILDSTGCTHQKTKLVFLLVTTLKEKIVLKVTTIEVQPLTHSSASSQNQSHIRF